MRPIDNAYTCQGSQREQRKMPAADGGGPSPFLYRRRFAEWAFMEPWKEGSSTELLGGAVNVHSVTMLMRESAKYAVAAGHIHP